MRPSVWSGSVCCTVAIALDTCRARSTSMMPHAAGSAHASAISETCCLRPLAQTLTSSTALASRATSSGTGNARRLAVILRLHVQTNHEVLRAPFTLTPPMSRILLSDAILEPHRSFVSAGGGQVHRARYSRWRAGAIRCDSSTAILRSSVALSASHEGPCHSRQIRDVACIPSNTRRTSTMYEDSAWY